MRSVLITGCSGYVGSDMSLYFNLHGWEVFGIDSSAPSSQLARELADFEQKKVQKLMAPPWKVDAVLHLAGASKIVDDYPDEHYFDNNVGTTKHLRELYPDVPIYLASTTAMFDENAEIKHLHPYTESKAAAEEYANVVFRMGTIVGANHAGDFHGVIDMMLDSICRRKELLVAEGAKMRPLAGLTYICAMWHRAVSSGRFAERSMDEGALVIQHLYETVQSIENVSRAVIGYFKGNNPLEFKVIRRNDLKGIEKQAPPISSIPPDFELGPLNDIRLARLVAECVERYEGYTGLYSSA